MIMGYFRIYQWQKPSIWISLLEFLSLMLVGMDAGYCFEADGHTKVEFAQGVCCNPLSYTTSQVSSIFLYDKAFASTRTTQDECRDCIDIPILNLKYKQCVVSGQNNRPQSQPATFIPSSRLRNTFTESKINNISSIPLSAVSSAITCLRAIILLI